MQIGFSEFFFVAKPFLQRFDLGGVVTEFCLPSFTERLGPVNQCLPTQRKVLPSFFTEFFFFQWVVGGCWNSMDPAQSSFFYRVFLPSFFCSPSLFTLNKIKLEQGDGLPSFTEFPHQRYDT